MPSVIYRALYARPACNTCNTSTAYASVTTYRPFLGTYQTRLVPYTTYRPIYVPAISYQSCYLPSPCASCGPVSCGSSCSSCVSPSCSSCGVSSSGCSSCSAGVQAAPQSSPPQTFQQKTEKPAAKDNLQPIPQTDTQLNSMPAPKLPDPNDRTASRPATRQAARVIPVAYSVPAPADRNDGGWHEVRN